MHHLKKRIILIFIFLATVSLSLNAANTTICNTTGKEVTIFILPEYGTSCKMQKVPARDLKCLIEHDFTAYAIVAIGQGQNENLNKCVLTSDYGIQNFKFFIWDGKFLMGGN